MDLQLCSEVYSFAESLLQYRKNNIYLILSYLILSYLIVATVVSITQVLAAFAFITIPSLR